jgi:hypothetical protein
VHWEHVVKEDQMGKVAVGRRFEQRFVKRCKRRGSGSNADGEHGRGLFLAFTRSADL